MFCYQCQETAGGVGCKLVGVCGKKPEVANAQDLLIHLLKGIGVIAHLLQPEQPRTPTSPAAPSREEGEPSCACTSAEGSEQPCPQRRAVYDFVADALFATITNANFDQESIYQRVDQALALKQRMLDKARQRGVALPPVDAVLWQGSREEYALKATQVGVLAEADEDLRSLKELTLYGLKGMAAYLEHATRLGQRDESCHEFIFKALSQLALSQDAAALTALALETGEYGVRAMALLDTANTSTYGHPEMTQVALGVGTRPGILVSGHDLHDLEQLLQQSEGEGIDIYTHGEMLPAHYYPRLKQYAHLKGNYGNAWWRQREEFETFRGPILFTTNCIVPPTARATYAQRVFTTGSTAYPGWQHIQADEQGRKDFAPLIALAKTCQPPIEIETGTLTGGFAHNQVFALADQIVEAVKTGAIRKFIVMAGCDGRMKSRDYYTDFAQQLPQDCVILTAGCAKYKYNKLPLAPIGDIPRVLDAGQCNDSYSLALIALKLKEAFALEDINQLPIHYNIAWYEQKAVIVLLALLHLGVKHIHLGPTLPAFLSPSVAKVLVENFGIAGIGTVEDDLKAFGI